MTLEGTLQDMPLSDLIQVFQMGPKTGRLLLVTTHECGVIHVAAGSLIDAAVMLKTQRKVIATRDEAVLHMFTWTNATFVFRHDPSVRRHPLRIERNSAVLMIEGMRRRNASADAPPYCTLTLKTEVQLTPFAYSTQSNLYLDAAQRFILQQIPSCRSIQILTEVTGKTLGEVFHLIEDLLALGLIEVVAAPRSVPLRQQRPVATPRHNPASFPVPILAEAAVAGSAPPMSTPSRAFKHSLVNAVMRRVREL